MTICRQATVFAVILVHSVISQPSLTQSYLETGKRVIGKQCRPRIDGTSYGI